MKLAMRTMRLQHSWFSRGTENSREWAKIPWHRLPGRTLHYGGSRTRLFRVRETQSHCRFTEPVRFTQRGLSILLIKICGGPQRLRQDCRKKYSQFLGRLSFLWEQKSVPKLYSDQRSFYGPLVTPKINTVATAIQNADLCC